MSDGIFIAYSVITSNSEALAVLNLPPQYVLIIGMVEQAINRFWTTKALY